MQKYLGEFEIRASGFRKRISQIMKGVFMKKVVLIFAVLFFISSASADMICRVTFNKDANDTVGSLKSSLRGTATVADGKLNLDGKGWVEYPGGIVSKLDCATTEVWFTYRSNTNWVRVFDFGNTNEQGNGAYVWYFTPRAGRVSRTTFSNTDPGSKYEEIINNGQLPQDVPVHVVVIFDSKNSKSRLYINGKLIGEKIMTVKLSDIGTQHLYLGKSSYNSDRPLQGTIDEFRIYNGPLSDLQILLDSQTGPDNLQKCVLTSVKPANDANNIPTNAALSWTMDENIKADHYEVAFGTDVNSLLQTAKISPTFTSTKQLSFTPSGLKAGAAYYWRVDTIDADKKRFIGPVLKFTAAQ
jgi:hypothetical protein